ncbi:hypothetical protein [Beijerinckia indica]|nr:hypothetical protein [Beijerinckia indica]
MKSFHKILFALMAFGVILTSGLAVKADSLGSRSDSLGFFGRPYPYGYVVHEPRDECLQTETIETPEGPRQRFINVCENPLHSRY